MIVFAAAVSSISVALQGYIQSAVVGLCIAYAIMVCLNLFVFKYNL